MKILYYILAVMLVVHSIYLPYIVALAEHNSPKYPKKEIELRKTDIFYPLNAISFTFYTIIAAFFAILKFFCFINYIPKCLRKNKRYLSIAYEYDSEDPELLNIFVIFLLGLYFLNMYIFYPFLFVYTGLTNFISLFAISTWLGICNYFFAIVTIPIYRK